MGEQQPLMDEEAGIRNTTVQFLRSFSVISDDSDFDELDEPDTPADFLDQSHGDADSSLADGLKRTPTCNSGGPDGSRCTEIAADSKLIPFSAVHKPRKGFQSIRPHCWMKEPITVRVTDVQRQEHPHMTRNAFNPNLYTIEIIHGEYRWTVRRRYKHFDSLHKALRLFRARYSLPVPTKQHRETRLSFKEDRKERKIRKKAKKISRFPKRPEIMVRGEEALNKRGGHLEEYLQSILESKWYRNHTEVLTFLEVSELSFINKLGQKWKEGDINKCSGGRRISIGCCGCLKKYHVAGRWSNRWLIVKDTFLAYVRPSDGQTCDVMLMDSDFKVESGMKATGAPHGLLVMNLTRHLLAKCWTSRKADEWEAGIKQAATTTGRQFTQENRYASYAPIREKSYARWFVDGASYFEAVADALEKAKEEIFITDWWLSPEIYLKRNVTDRERWRLDAILVRKAKAGVKVFILLYKELEIALTINSHYSKHALMDKCPENIKVIRHPDHMAGGNRVLLWAHHEKMVVIDQKTAFLGGLDLCYGRWDDEHHRMTDLGSVMYNSSFEHNDKNGKSETVKPDHLGLPNHPHSHHHSAKQKTASRKHKAYIHRPSPIMEASETSVDEDLNKSQSSIDTGHQSETSCKTAESGFQSMQIDKEKCSQNNEANICVPVIETKISTVQDRDNANVRLSYGSEQSFGSSENLTDNDSLENIDKVGCTNVIAEVTVHESITNGQNVSNTQHNDAQVNSDDRVSNDSSIMCSNVCNRSNGEEVAESVCDTAQLPVVNGTKTKPFTKTVLKDLDTENKTNGSRNGVHVDDIEYVEKDNASLTTIERQIVQNGNHLSEQGNDSSAMDCNKNQTTKSSVSFRENTVGEIEEEKIVPAESMPIEGTPKKKDAISRRETWAMKKLQNVFGLKGDKADDEDKVDGKADRSDSDEEDAAGGSHRFRSKWRLVLNIKKLEHTGKQEGDEEVLPPESPFSKHNKSQSPHQSLSVRIKQSIPFRPPFRTQRRDSSEDLYYDLYPWKRKQKEDGVVMRSVMKMAIDDDFVGLEGSSKLWIGKDYINFIHKDPVDVHNPFEDFIERDKTPRMPWHDIGAVVYGKSARDVARHFIGRWNFTKTEKFKKNKAYPLLVPKSYNKCVIPPAIKDITYEVDSQILRSLCGWSGGIKQAEKSIHTAYLDCIENAKHYIYIENQFFISQVGDHTMVKNEICEALVKRIERAHKNQEKFRVYVVVPLLPAFEGEIGGTGGYAIQAVMHWNYLSISKGPHSLWSQLQNKVGDPLKYLVFCGLRSHTELSGKLITELVYVHSKLMIIDDNIVIIGSANINDRSMIGSRDSEMAVLTEDVQKFPVKMGGKDHEAGRFASSLRRTLFREHLGIDELETGVDLTDPVSDSFYKHVWIERATKNTTIYHKVFKCIPNDYIHTFADIKEDVKVPSLAESDPTLAKEELKKIKGRLVLLPLNFLDYEDSIIPVGPSQEGILPMKVWT